MTPWIIAAMALAGAVLGWLVPTAIGRLPEPEPVFPDDAVEAEAKIPYADFDQPRHRPWTALATAVVAGSLGTLGWSGASPALTVFAAVAVLLTWVDFRTKYLPRRIVWPSYAVLAVLLVVGALIDGTTQHLVRAAIAGGAVFGFFLVMWLIYPRGIGFGDVRMSGMLGMVLGYLGWAETIAGGYAMFVTGAVGGLLLTRLRVFDRRKYPFGPFMMLGALIGAIAGPALAGGLGY